MATATEPYIPRSPGDLVTAEDWNYVQKKIKEDIAKQVKDAVDAKTSVANADNAAKLENKTPEELAQEIVRKALAELTKVTGYRQLFKRLKLNDEKVIEHKLEACPLVDVYQLDYFKVVCSEDEQKQSTWVNFYLYHTSEKTLRFTPPGGGGTEVIEIERTDEPFYRIPFYDMLARYGVEYTETSTLDDLETEFWDKFFAKPNDRFDDDQYCHSPWFDRCCGDRRTVKELKSRGDWDEIWFKMVPRKTINYPQAGATTTPPATAPSPAPTQVQIVHFDFNTIGLKLLADPVLQVNLPVEFKTSIEAKQELKVMVLLNAGAGVKIEKPAGQQ